ncbi:MAG: hypothetical protein KDB87_11210 [Flavobacteriales bacterium]|nr:hypothetical protein [Flavobacteriales bacterium]
MAKILFNDASEAHPPSDSLEEKKKPLPNIFQGREEAQPGAGNARFPSWDIIPPDQIINPRIPRS